MMEGGGFFVLLSQPETGFGETGGVDYPTARGLYVEDLINKKRSKYILAYIHTQCTLECLFHLNTPTRWPIYRKFV